MYRNKRFIRTSLITLLASSIHSSAVDYNLNLRFGGQRNFLSIENNLTQAMPFLVTGEATYPCGANTVNANPAFAGNANPNKTIAAKNLDTTAYNQLTLGLKGNVLPNIQLPNQEISIGLSASINGTYESKPVSTQAQMYILTPLTTLSADIGALGTNNGNSVEVGAGVQALRYEMTTGEVFDALGSMDNAGNNLDTTAFINSDKTQYEVKMDYVIAPYLYTEVSTHLGDVATVFAKGIYAPKTSPKFSAEANIANTQMFPGGQSSYENNYEWEISSITIGIQAQLY